MARQTQSNKLLHAQYSPAFKIASLLGALLAAVISLSASASDVRFDPASGILNVPAVDVSSASGGLKVFEASLQLVNDNPLIFEVISASQSAERPGSGPLFNLDTGLAFIPKVLVGSQIFAGTLSLLPASEPLQFVVTNVHPVKEEPIAFSTLPDRIETNIPTFFVSGQTQPDSQITINGVSIPADVGGNFVTPVSLASGENTIILVIESEEGVKSATKTVVFDPGLSTADRRLLYIDSVSPLLLGTLVIDIDNNVFLGVIDDKHVRGVAPSGTEIYTEDRSVISTATHRELGAPASPLGFSEELPNNGFLVSPDGSRLYARDEILDLATNSVLAEKLPLSIETGIGLALVPGGPAISADGLEIFAGPVSIGGNTTLIDVEKNLAIDTGISSGRTRTRFVSDLALNHDGRFLLRAAYNFARGQLDIFDATTFANLATIRGLGDFTGEIVLSADGRKAIVGSAGNPALRGGAVTVIDIPSFKRDFRISLDLADNLAISDRNEIFVSSGNTVGVDVFALHEGGRLVKMKSLLLGINWFLPTSGIPINDEIRKIVLKP